MEDALNKRNIARGICFFCSMELERSRHRFLSYSMAIMVWRYINLVWMSLIGARLSSFIWVFVHTEKVSGIVLEAERISTREVEKGEKIVCRS